MKKQTTAILITLLLTALFAGCNDTTGVTGEDPYGGGKESLGIQFQTLPPEPDSGWPGDTILFRTRGLDKWFDSSLNTYLFEFYLASEPAKIVQATDTTLFIVVPENVSSGIAHIILEDQVFFGPRFSVKGNISIDTDHNLYNKENGPVYDFLERRNNKNSFYLFGSFEKLGNQDRYGIGLIDSRGNVAGTNSDGYRISAGVKDNLYSASYFSNGQMLISGSFRRYENYGSTSSFQEYGYINNITLLNNDASLAMEEVELLPTTTGISTAEVPVFNGGTGETILRSFVTQDDRVIVAGNLKTYYRFIYEESSLRDRVLERKDLATVARMDKSGKLDDEYRKGLRGVTGTIEDACMDEQEGILLTGDFTSFDGMQVNHIVRLDNEGRVDTRFLANTGTGANGAIRTIRYNQTFGKFMITGLFTEYDGEPRPGVALLNSDGTLDETFIPRTIEGGSVNYAQLLDRDKIVLSGTFTRYDNIHRNGFLLLDRNGKATQHFNVPGTFSGQLYQVVETETTQDSYGLLLLGSFNRFNDRKVENVLMIGVDFVNEEEE